MLTISLATGERCEWKSGFALAGKGKGDYTLSIYHLQLWLK